MFLSALFSFPVQAKGEMEIGKLLWSGNELPRNTGGGTNKTYKRPFQAESAADDLRRRRRPESPALKAWTPGSQRAAKENILASDVLFGGRLQLSKKMPPSVPLWVLMRSNLSLGNT